MAKATALAPARDGVLVARVNKSDLAVGAMLLALGIALISAPRVFLWLWPFWAGGY